MKSFIEDLSSLPTLPTLPKLPTFTNLARFDVGGPTHPKPGVLPSRRC